ncbi:cobalamin biosynthesis protein [Paraburkholderia megapolitana]|uniref:cobalamin biosynthesis protein n=1 Tax=Paraburkholderia megapolitana TaxID=420953 RepID=UPI0038BBBC2A
MTKTLIAGIGCRRNVSADQIDAALRAALGTRSLAEIREIATVDTKANEPGLLEFCARHALPLRLFTPMQIAAIPLAPPARSAAARVHLGIDGVCEPCARLAAPHGYLIVGKTVYDGVTVALVADPLVHSTLSASTDQDLDR